MPDRVLVITSYPQSWAELAAITCATHKKWADRHGYDYYADCSDVSAPSRSPEWRAKAEGYIPIRGFIKLDLMLHFLDSASCRKEYDWVVWIDADALITNYDVSLERWTKPGTHDLVLPYDANGHNVTVIMARNTELVFDFLWACNNAGRSMFIKHDWAEMEALRYFLQTPPYFGMAGYYSVKELCAMPPDQYAPHVPKRVSQKYEWSEGDWCLHFSALPLAKRIELASKYAEELKLL